MKAPVLALEKRFSAFRRFSWDDFCLGDASDERRRGLKWWLNEEMELEEAARQKAWDKFYSD